MSKQRERANRGIKGQQDIEKPIEDEDSKLLRGIQQQTFSIFQILDESFPQPKVSTRGELNSRRSPVPVGTPGTFPVTFAPIDIVQKVLIGNNIEFIGRDTSRVKIPIPTGRDLFF